MTQVDDSLLFPKFSHNYLTGVARTDQRMALAILEELFHQLIGEAKLTGIHAYVMLSCYDQHQQITRQRLLHQEDTPTALDTLERVLMAVKYETDPRYTRRLRSPKTRTRYAITGRWKGAHVPR